MALVQREYDLRTKQLADEQKTLNDTIAKKNAKIRSLQATIEEHSEKITNFEKEVADKEIERQMLDSMLDDLKKKLRDIETTNFTEDQVALRRETSLLKTQLQEQLGRNAEYERNIARLKNEIENMNNFSPPPDAPITMEAISKLIDAKLTPLLNAHRVNTTTYARAPTHQAPMPRLPPQPMNTPARQPAAANVEENNATKISYAQALHTSRTPIACIRNIVLLGEAHTVEATYERIMNDKANTEIKFLSIVRHSSQSITVKCADEESAIALDQHLDENYRDLLEVKVPQEKAPSIKITNIRAKFTDLAELKETLTTQNQWAANANFEFIDFYPVSNSARTYYNAIMSCDLESHALLLEKGSVIIGMQQ